MTALPPTQTPPPEELRAAALEFRDVELGIWSSHPHWRNRRRIQFQLAAAVILSLILISAVGFVSMDPEGILDFLRALQDRVLLVGVSIGTVIAALTTFAITDRWAHLQSIGAVTNSMGRIPFEPHVIGLCLLLGCLGPLGLAHLQGVPTSVRFIANLFAVFPLFGLVVGMRILEARHAEGERSVGRASLLWLLAALASLFGVSLAQGLPTLLSTEGATFSNWMVSAFALIPMMAMVYCVYRAFPRIETADEPETPHSPIERFIAWVMSLLGMDEAEESGLTDAPDEDLHPDWLPTLLENLPSGVSITQDAHRVAVDETSALSTREDLRPFFGGHLPTRDQLQVLDGFTTSYETSIRAMGTNPGHREEIVSADFLIHGMTGSGRSTTLLALATYAAFVRGQRVVLLVPDSARVDALLKRFDTFLGSMNLGHYVEVAPLVAERAQQWMRDGEGGLPNILIATVDAIETHLYGIEPETRDGRQRQAELIQQLEVFLVDDFLDHGHAERSHLRFLLAKQRLLLAAEGVPIQTVVSCPPLARFAQHWLAAQLFAMSRADHVLEVRPAPVEPGWRVELEAQDVNAALEALILRCLEISPGTNGAPMHVVLYRRGIDETTRGAQERRLRSEVAGSGVLRVVADLDQHDAVSLLGTDDVRADAIFHQIAADEDACVALRVHLGMEETVVFSLRRQGEVLEERQTGVIPIVADRSSETLLVTHLESILRLLPAMTPLDEDDWRHFGLHDRDLPRRKLHGRPVAELEVDRLLDDQYAPGDVWPYVVVRQSGRSRTPRPVNVHGLPAPDHTNRIFHSLEGTRVFIAADPTRRPEGEDLATRWSRWLHPSGKPIREGVDLVHQTDFRLKADGEVYVADAIDIRDGHVEFHVSHWQSDGTQPYIPIRHLEWTLPGDMRRSPIHAGGGPQHGLSWFGVVNGEGDSEKDEVDVRGVITGRMDDAGRVTSMHNLRFGFEARMFALVFNPSQANEDHLQRIRGEQVAGPRSTEGDAFLPGLTGALNHAVNSRVPGFRYFAQVAAFSLAGSPGAELGDAIAFIVQPRSSGQAPASLLHAMFSDVAERTDLFRSAQWFLDRAADTPSPARFLRENSRLGFVKDSQFSVEHFALSREVLKKAISPEDIGDPSSPDALKDSATSGVPMDTTDSREGSEPE